jgi:hypothetical protein
MIRRGAPKPAGALETFADVILFYGERNFIRPQRLSLTRA